MKLFLILIAPFVALIVLVQVMRCLNSWRSESVQWRGAIRTRQDNPRLFWALIAWNVALTVAIALYYAKMWAEALGEPL